MVPGFRKGKAPHKMMESMYGESIFYDDAINDVAPEAYYFSVKEAELKVVAMPSIEKADVTEDKGLELVINATLYPEVKLGQYKGLEAVRKAVTVDPYEVDSQIELLRNRNSSLITAERAAKFGDTVVIDYEGTIDGVPFDGGKDENYSLEIGSNTFIPVSYTHLIARKHGGISETITGRRVSYNVGCEKVFPLHSPNIVSITPIRRGKVRRAKLYYIRDRVGKQAKVKEKI